MKLPPATRRIDADWADGLVHLELHESEVTELGHPLPGIIVPHRHTEQRLLLRHNEWEANALTTDCV